MVKSTWKNSVTKNNLCFCNFRWKREKMNTTLLACSSSRFTKRKPWQDDHDSPVWYSAYLELTHLFWVYKIPSVCSTYRKTRRKRGERFGRLGSCTESVQANKVQACNGKDSEHLPKHGEEATWHDRASGLSQDQSIQLFGSHSIPLAILKGCAVAILLSWSAMPNHGRCWLLSAGG